MSAGLWPFLVLYALNFLIFRKTFQMIKQLKFKPDLQFRILYKKTFDSCGRFYLAILNNDESNVFIGERCFNSHCNLQVCSFERCEKSEVVKN